MAYFLTYLTLRNEEAVKINYTRGSSASPTPNKAPMKACTLDTGSFTCEIIMIVATADNCEANPLELLMYVSLLPRHCVRRQPHTKNPVDAPSPPIALIHH